ncbi:ChaN family lipoprotein [Palleronia sp. KMU-117]|uniref:ChaN family lipoprotein n=1 Tax=Palleronia sp. KMU-117 TaxID=3434108 RepID=UPI003D73F2EF
MIRAALGPTAGAVLWAALSASGSEAVEIDATGLYDLPPADIVVLGEVHDNPVHHAHQAIAVEAIAPRAIVFEMLSPDQAGRITPALLASEPALGAVLGWDAAGWPDFGMYYPVFLAARGAAFRGGTETVAAARQAVRDGAAAVFGEGAEAFALDRPLPEVERALRIEEQRVAHCDALPDDLLPGMVEAQRLRDAWLARATLAAHAETGGPVVVITGNGHARTDWGVPALLAAAAPGLSVLSVGQYEEAADAAPPFDLWLVTEAAARADPCKDLRP